MALPINETQFASRVLAYAQLRRWHVVHYRPAKTKTGWRTPLVGHRGAPDLLLAREGTVILAELKSENGGMRPGQAAWGRAIGQAHYRLWRPSDWDEIEKELR
jgi:hypothetical protein